MADQETEIDIRGFEHLIPRPQAPDIDDEMFELLVKLDTRRADLQRERLIQPVLREFLRLLDHDHDEAIRRIEAHRAGSESGRRAKRGRGRPAGFKYHDIDERLMVLASFLGIEWENRGHPRPSRHAMYTKIVDLCSDREAYEIFGTWFEPFEKLGSSKRSVVSRLMSRTNFPSEIKPKDSKSRLHDLLPPSEDWFHALVPTSEAWETVHQRRPDL